MTVKLFFKADISKSIWCYAANKIMGENVNTYTLIHIYTNVYM